MCIACVRKNAYVYRAVKKFINRSASSTVLPTATTPRRPKRYSCACEDTALPTAYEPPGFAN